MKGMTKASLIKQMVLSTIPVIVGYNIGSWFDRQEDNRMIKFRDKSALYGRELKPGQPPSWT